MQMIKKSRFWYLLAIIAALVLLFLLPYSLRYQHQDFLIFLLINILVVVSYRLVTLTGEWSLIHMVMMGVGAYSSAFLTKLWGLSFWLSLPLSGMATAAIAGLLCFPLFRTSQFYFLIGSFAAGESIRLLWIYFVNPFGGSSGINNLPVVNFFGYDLFDAIPYYHMVLICVTICLLILHRIEHSKIGLTLHAVHWQPKLAQSVGIDLFKYRAMAFMIGCFFVGIAGGLKVHYLSNVTPHQFDIESMVFVLIWVIVGGYRTFYGPIIGVVILSVLDEFLRTFEVIRPALYGIILIATILFLPKGLESLFEKLKHYLTQTRKI